MLNGLLEFDLIYQTLNHQIDVQALTVNNADNINLHIRPKTCQLLILLLENAGHPMSKQKVLETVWAGSVVSDQVVFQSINEIRQLFPDTEVIKTIPKQGYMWLPDVRTIEQTTPFSLFQNKYLGVIATLLLFISLFLVVKYKFTESEEVLHSQSSVSGSIVILPTQNLIEGNDHSWVRLGMECMK